MSCKHCGGACEMTPVITPLAMNEGRGTRDHRSFEDFTELTDLFIQEHWSINIKKGYLFHNHPKKKNPFTKSGYYRVFNHYFKGRNPILVCSLCNEQLPPEIYNTLKAGYRIWNLKK